MRSVDGGSVWTAEVEPTGANLACLLKRTAFKNVDMHNFLRWEKKSFEISHWLILLKFLPAALNMHTGAIITALNELKCSSAQSQTPVA